MNGLAVVCGCGRLGAGIASALSEREEDTVVIDHHKDAFSRLDLSYAGLTVTGDVTDLDVLDEAHVKQAGLILAVTDSDNVNVMTGQLARTLNKNARIILRLQDLEKACLVEGMDIETISPFGLAKQDILERIQK